MVIINFKELSFHTILGKTADITTAGHSFQIMQNPQMVTAEKKKNVYSKSAISKHFVENVFGKRVVEESAQATLITTALNGL